MRLVTYRDALHAALSQAMEEDPTVCVMGIGVDDHKAVFGSTKDLVKRFGPHRVFDTPIAEGGMTGVAIGAALGGLKPVHIHIRCDFLYLALDQLLNLAAKWRSMFGGQMSVPLVVRAVVGRSWGQGAQHSQSLQSFMMHVPGIKVAMPTTAYDAQGLLLSAIADPNPVFLLEHRLLYELTGEVPDYCRAIPFGKTVVRREGDDVTLVANSYMAVEALRAADVLSGYGIQAEVVDPVSLVPMDEATILNSVRKTGRLVVVDTSWVTCGVSAEIAALVAEKAFDSLKAPVKRLGMQRTVCPVSKPLERAFYPHAGTIVAEVLDLLGEQRLDVQVPETATSFKGPF
ncbi:MAG: alpha-ketoacid dehydrogenase subunit beta [Nitrospirae bacterium]|nr:alpha-ketoacid dehydrogenase subunit beta [Nitrospirota bacterium]